MIFYYGFVSSIYLDDDSRDEIVVYFFLSKIFVNN